MGCIADYGCFVIDYEPNEEIMETGIDKFLEHYQNRSIKTINFSKSENSLVTFFMQLTRYLQQAIGTVAAIDLNSYLSTIGETLDEEI